MKNRKIGTNLRFTTKKDLLALFLASAVGVAALAGPSLASEVNARSLRYYEQAQEHMASGDTAAAVIEYKNAIRTDPNNLEARMALAGIYNSQLNGVSAEKELRAARSRGMPMDKILIPLASAMLIQAKYQELLEELPLSLASQSNRVELGVYRAQAALAARQLEQAEKELVAIEGEASDREEVWLVRSWVLDRQGKSDEALESIDKALALAPTSARFLLQKGEIYRQTQKFAEAVPYYDKVLEQNPLDMKARLGRGYANLGLQNIDAVEADAEIILERFAREPNASYMKALVLARKGQSEEAIDVLSKAYRIEENASAMYLAANLYLNTNQLEQARASINKYLTMQPTSLRGLVVSATVFLQNEEAEKAVDILERVHEAAPRDLRVVVLLANGYSQLGEFAKAADLYDIAIQSQPESEDLRYRAAQTRLNEGQVDLAIAGLESIVFSDLSSHRAAVLLFLTHLKQNEVAQARVALTEIEKITGQTAETENFNATVALLENDFDAANQHLKKSLSIDPGFVVAKINLARMHYSKGETQEAEQLFEEVLSAQPGSIPAVDGIIAIAREQGDNEKILAVLEAAVRADPKSIAANAKRVQELINQGRKDKALVAAQEFYQNLPEVPEALDAQAKAQIAVGQYNSAVVTYRKLQTMLPDNPLVRIRLAEAMVTAKDPAAAKDVLDKAIGYFPDEDVLRQKRILLEQQVSGDKSAETLAEGIYAQVKDPLQRLLGLGNILMALGNEQEAIKVYRQAYDSADRQGVLPLYRALDRTGNKPEAERVLREWMEGNPEDKAIQSILSSFLIQNGKFNEAIIETEKLQKMSPEDPIVLNNLAWLYEYVGRHDEAIALSKQAHTLSPTAGELADTYGWILFSNGRQEEALDILTDAAKRLPRDSEVQYHYAAALAHAGQPRKALEILHGILDTAAPFPGKEEAIKLRDKLMGN